MALYEPRMPIDLTPRACRRAAAWSRVRCPRKAALMVAATSLSSFSMTGHRRCQGIPSGDRSVRGRRVATTAHAAVAGVRNGGTVVLQDAVADLGPDPTNRGVQAWVVERQVEHRIARKSRPAALEQHVGDAGTVHRGPVPEAVDVHPRVVGEVVELSLPALVARQRAQGCTGETTLMSANTIRGTLNPHGHSGSRTGWTCRSGRPLDAREPATGTGSSPRSRPGGSCGYLRQARAD